MKTNVLKDFKPPFSADLEEEPHDMFETIVFNSMLPPETEFKELNPTSTKTRQGKKRALHGQIAKVSNSI